MMREKARQSGVRRGSALFTALLVVAAGAVIGMSVLSAGSRASMVATRATARLDQRTLAWSAVQAVMADLGSQREQLLQGEAPALKGEYSLWRDGSRTATARLMAFASASAMDDAPPVAQPEGGKLDLNLAEREALVQLGVMEESVVDAIIARRAQRPWSSVEELASLPGIGETELFGGARGEAGEGARAVSVGARTPTTSNFTPPSSPTAPDGKPDSTKSNGKPGSEPNGESGGKMSEKGAGGNLGAMAMSALPLTSVLTVHNFDPSVSSMGGGRAEGLKGSGAGAGDDGDLGARLNVREASTTLAAEIDERCGKGASLLLKALKDVPLDVASGTALVMAMRQAAVPAGVWPAVLDELTTTGDPFVQGLVDVNTADARVLATVPGIDAAAATAIVEARHSLGGAKRASMTWPLTEGILDLDKFQVAAGRLTTRSMQWRVRIEAGLAGESGGAGSETELSDRVVIDVIVDVADARPRLAYMRDVTLLPAAMVLNERFKGAARKAAEELPPPDPMPPTTPEPPPLADADSTPPPPPPDPMPQTPVNQADNRDAPPVEPSRPTIHDPRTGRWTPGRKAQ
ncbi:MAG: helix-hairpin-helix domain-containing protein [Planctomycetota bacterium]